MKKKLFLTFSLVIMLCCFVFGIYFVSAGNSYSFSGGEIEVDYQKHEMFKVPDAKFGTFKANYVTTFPSGQKVTDYYFKLTEGGNYQIEYSATVDGKKLTKKVDFTVDTPAYSVEKYQSTAEYGKDNKYNSGNKGIKVSLYEGDTFHYNKVVNVYDSSKNNPVIDFGFYPETFNKIDANNMYMTFTDIYDSNNVVTCWFNLASTHLNYCKLFTKATNQVWGGYEHRGANGLTYHKNNQYGTPINLKPGYYGTDADNDFQKHLGIYFDNENNALKVNDILGYGGWHSVDVNNYFGDPSLQENPWNGFTTGDVYIDIWFENYNTNTAGFIINSILEEDLTEKEFKDKVAPVIDIEETFDTSINAIKGYYYPVNTATASDILSGGTVDCSVNVFYNYSRSSGVYYDFDGSYEHQVEIENGRFKVEKQGFYAICYRAKDWYGNMVEKVVSVKVDSSTDVIPVTGLTLKNTVDSAVVNSLCYLAEGFGAEGGVGGISYGYEITSSIKSYNVLYDYRNQPYFIPDSVGNYTVKVFAEDYFGVKCEQEYTVAVTVSSKIISDVPVLPAYFVAGCEYELPFVSIRNSNGEVIETAKIKVVDGNGERAYSNGATFTPDQDGNAKVIYYSEGVENVYIIPVLNVLNNWGEIVGSNYFVMEDGISASMSINGTEFNATKDASARFAIPQLCSSLSLSFASKPDKTNFEEMVVTLTDSEDYSNTISVGLINNGDSKCFVSINGKPTIIRVHGFAFSSQKICDIKYSNATCSFLCDSRNIVIDQTLFGKEFKGFTSGKVYIDITFKGVTGESAVVLTGINQQMINIDTASDSTGPDIWISGSYKNLTAIYGSTFNIYKALASDVFDPSVKVNVSLTIEATNTAVQSTDSVTLNKVPCDREYSVILNEYGTYLLKYLSVDKDGNQNSVTYRIQVKDNESPVLTVPNVPVEFSLGKITLPLATATDNVTKQPVTWLCVYDPAGDITYVKDGEYTAKHSGIYKAIYYAIDEEGNTASQVYYFAVK